MEAGTSKELGDKGFVTDNEAIEAARTIKKYCKGMKCYMCPFFDRNNLCRFEWLRPPLWRIPHRRVDKK